MNSTTSTLVGRASELEALAGLIRSLAEGNGGSALIEGEPGIGKSRLLDEAVGQTKDLGVAVFAGRARELEQDLPFALIGETLGVSASAKDPVRSEIAAMLAGGDVPPEAAGQLRFRIAAAITDLIEGLTEERPTLLVIDDLQWADASTLLVLARMAARVGHLPLGIVCTTRPYPRPAGLEDIDRSIRSTGGLHLTLAPLADGEVSEVARASLGAEIGPNLSRELSSTAGNPMFVLELLAAVKDAGQLEGSAGEVEVAVTETPPSLRLTILRRLSFLPAPTTDALRLAAVLGPVFDATDLSEAIGIRTSELADRLAPAITSDLIVERSGELAFRHDLVQAALYEDLAESVRRGMHRDVARILGEAGRPAGLIAFHVARAAAHGDAEAVAWLRRAAADAAHKDPSIAVEHLERARELADPDYPEMDDLHIELARALQWSGRPREGEELAREVLTRIPSGPRARSVRLIVLEALGRQGKLDASVGELEATAREENVPENERVRLLASAARGWAQVGELERARALAEEARTIARRIGDVGSESLSLITLAFSDACSGYAERAVEHATASVQVARGREDELPVRIEYPLGNLATMLSQAERFQEALEALKEAAEEAERTGRVLWQASIQGWRGTQLFLMGRWADAITDFETALAFAEQVEGWDWVLRCRAGLSKVAVHQDDLGAAERWLEETPALLAEGIWPATLLRLCHARAALLEAQGEPGGALDALRVAYETVRRTDFGYFALWFAPEFVRMAKEGGDLEASEGMVRIAEEAAERMETPSARGQARLSRGLLTADATVLLEAVEVHSRGVIVIDRAWAQEHAADQLTLDGRASEAVALLTEAADCWQGAGAIRELARVEAKLRGLGVRRAGTRRRPAARVGWESLSDTERRVVDLVAEGLVYREIGERMFISRRTVETHVTHVFQKLSVSSRKELATALQDARP